MRPCVSTNSSFWVLYTPDAHDLLDNSATEMERPLPLSPLLGRPLVGRTPAVFVGGGGGGSSILAEGLAFAYQPTADRCTVALKPKQKAHQAGKLLLSRGEGAGGEGKAEAGDEAVQEAQWGAVAAGEVVPVDSKAPAAPVGAVLLHIYGAE